MKILKTFEQKCEDWKRSKPYKPEMAADKEDNENEESTLSISDSAKKQNIIQDDEK